MIDAFAGVLEALVVAREHLEVRQQEVRKEHGLGFLEVGVAGEGDVGVGFSLLEEGVLEAMEEGADLVDGIAGIQA